MAVWIRDLRRGAELGGTGAIILGADEGTEAQRGPDLASSPSMSVADSCRVSVRGEGRAAQTVSVRMPIAPCRRSAASRLRSLRAGYWFNRLSEPQLPQF